jgi:NAD(P)-dependent dehydrogenase (short-subunit alcohol dehydrogenase family)
LHFSSAQAARRFPDEDLLDFCQRPRILVSHRFVKAGRIDVAINNAGYPVSGLAEAVTTEQAQRLMDTIFLPSLALVMGVRRHDKPLKFWLHNSCTNAAEQQPFAQK